MTTEPPKKKRPYRTCAHSLKTVQHVSIEMARTYRRAKRGDIPTSDGYRLVMMLAALKQALETGEVEAKIRQLEEAIAAQQANVAYLKPRLLESR